MKKAKSVLAFVLGGALYVAMVRYRGAATYISYALDAIIVICVVLTLYYLPETVRKLRAEAVPAQKTDIIGYVVILGVLGGVIWLGARLVR